jgi:hypothetical protein
MAHGGNRHDDGDAEVELNESGSEHPSPTVCVIVTAPHGLGGMERILDALRPQLRAGDRLVVLDGGAAGDALALPGLSASICVDHVRRPGASAFHLRAELPALADRDIALLFEDHAIPGPRFVDAARRLFAGDRELAAVKVLGRNDTSTDRWSWVNFLMAFAELLQPTEALPPALLATSAAVRRSVLPEAPLPLGAWETAFLPSLNSSGARLASSNEVYVDHVDFCDMRTALSGNFHNQRVIASFRVAAGHRRGKLAWRAIKDLGFRRHRAIARALSGRDEARHAIENRGKLILVGWAAAFGAIVGAWFGRGNALDAMH